MTASAGHAGGDAHDLDVPSGVALPSARTGRAGDEAVQAFVEEVAHHLRTPLTTLLTHAHLIQDPARHLAQKGTDAEAIARIVESAAAIQESAERLAGEIRRIAQQANPPRSVRKGENGSRKKA